ncbi:AAA family ATPase [Vibrio parahaemolyticus]|uniref:AAA family ATPase n=1 Tax=Vibrio parahaemolyticus TaxID=670 RepID=UPI003F1CE36C
MNLPKKIVMYFRVTYVQHNDKQDKCFIRGAVSKRESRNTYSVLSSVKINTTCTGLPSIPAKGEYWKVIGEADRYLEDHDGFGRHIFEFNTPTALEFQIPNTLEEVKDFVAKSSDFQGIGTVRLFNIWDKYGDAEAMNIILRGDIEKLVAVELVSEEDARTLVEGFKKYTNLKYAKWFAEHRIPPFVQQNYFKMSAVIEDEHTGAKKALPTPPEVISDNPYHLTTLGMSFRSVDQLALTVFEKQLDDPNRLVSAVNQILNEQVVPRGHTFGTHNQIFPYLEALLESRELAALALMQSEQLLNFKLGDDGNYHHGALYIMQGIIAERISTLVNRKSNWCDFTYPRAINLAFKQLPFPLAQKQVEAVYSALEHEISIISGGAGTGKTTVLRTILRAFAELKYNIHGIALSGRAALRLHQSIGFPTKTITRFLNDEELESIDSAGEEVKHLVVIDEASMVDVPHMSQIILHCCPNVRFLIVGDHEQLAPIGSGKVLYDLIKSGLVPFVELEQVQRQDESTGIPEYSRVVRSGQIPQSLSNKSVHFHECDEQDIVEKCIEIYRRHRSNSQMVSATRKTTFELNSKCQAEFNSSSPELTYEYLNQITNSGLRLNDPVIFTRNHAAKRIQNGLLGELSTIEWTGDSYGGVQTQEYDEPIALTPELIIEMTLAYSITLHKAQGSQFPIVIVALNNSRMIDRSWIYTAITRSEQEVHIVGTKAKYLQAIQGGHRGHERQSSLQETLAAAVRRKSQVAPDGA